MHKDAIVISDDDEPALSRGNKSRPVVSRKTWVDLISDEENDSVQPPKASHSAPLADRGRQVVHSRVDQQSFRTRSPQVGSQRPLPSLAQDRSPLRRSQVTNYPAVSDYVLGTSADASVKPHSKQPHSKQPQALEHTAEGVTHERSPQGLVHPAARRSSPSPRSSPSGDRGRADSSHSFSHGVGRTKITPRRPSRDTDSHNLVSAPSYGTRSTSSKTVDTGEPEDGDSSETRYTSRRAMRGAPMSLFMGHMGGDSKRRISRARLGTSSSGQQHIDGEDSDNDNAARALRHSINAVLGPHSKPSDEAERSEDEVMEKTRGSLRDTVHTVTAPRGQASEEGRSSATNAVPEAATAQLQKGVFEPPTKARPLPSDLEALLFPLDGHDNPTSKDNLHSNATPPPQEDESSPRTQRMPSLAVGAGRRKTEGRPALAHWSEQDPPSEPNHVLLQGATSSHPASSQGSAPVDMEALTAMLKRHEMAMWSDQGYIIRPALRQAKLDCMQTAQPKLDHHLPDPFAGLVGSSFTPAEKVQANIKNAPQSKLQVQIFNNAYTQHNDGVIHFDHLEYVSPISALPKYKSIVRLGPNILAKNDRTLKYMPYFTSEEDPQSRQKKELLDELRKRYNDRVETLPAQRKCGELADFWRECVENFLSEIDVGFRDLLYALLEGSPRTASAKSPTLQAPDTCPSCKTSCPREDWDDLFRHVDSERFPRPDERRLAVARLACQVFVDVAKFSAWHIALTDSATRQLLRDLRQSTIDSTKPSTLCLICYLHDCPTHGAYLEHAPGSTGASESSEDSENDGELGHNIRQIVTISRPQTRSGRDHECGLYCLGRDIDSREILGLHADGDVKGVFNTAVEEDRPAGFDDGQLCSDDCFWAVEKREHASTMTGAARRWRSSPEKVSMYGMILPTFTNNRRGPCLISSALGDVSCLAVFEQMRSDACAIQHDAHPADVSAGADGKRSQAFDHAGENSNTHHLDNRIPFTPCSHPGPCDKDAGCSCYSNRISCERMCGCSKACGRRYHGCHCGAKNNSVCFKDDRCLCWLLNRECDPWLCGTCGVLDVLDPVNRYNEAIQNSHCRNAKLQRDVPRRTLKGKSDVQGWGLFAGEDMKKHEYIGEYKGEVVGEQESNRRGAVYHHRGLEYLFNLNKGQEIDSSRAGNKMRFINNSCKANIINVEAKKMFCNGVQRIMLFSKKHIDAGEELFFNYGYPKSVTKNFWERDELPGQAHMEDSRGGDDDDDDDDDAAGVIVPTKRPVGRPRKKGVVQKISPTKQPKSGGRWAKSVPDPAHPPAVGAGDEQEAPPSPAEQNGGVQQSSGRRKRKRKPSEGPVDTNDWMIRTDEPGTAGDHGGSEIADSEDDDFEDDLASQESSTDDEDDDDKDDDDNDDDKGLGVEEEATSDSDVVRRRRISAGDTRYGGKSQRAGWATRRLKAAQAAAAAAAAASPARPKKTRGMRSARGSWLGTGGRPPKRGK